MQKRSKAKAEDVVQIWDCTGTSFAAFNPYNTLVMDDKKPYEVRKIRGRSARCGEMIGL